MTVHLLAAGPGDPGLWTVRAEALLAASKLVVCDAELAEAVRPLAPTAVIESVPGAPEACAVLVDRAGDHDRIVRVARGDRLVWEAGGIEAAALADAGLAHEVVPAVVAAFAGPAAAGVPVMARPLAATLTVAVGVPRPEIEGGTVVTEDAPDGVAPVVTGAVTALAPTSDVRAPA